VGHQSGDQLRPNCRRRTRSFCIRVACVAEFIELRHESPVIFAHLAAAFTLAQMLLKFPIFNLQLQASFMLTTTPEQDPQDLLIR